MRFHKLQERYVRFVNNVTFTLSYEKMSKTKIVHLDELYNFYVHDFFSQNRLMFQNIIRSCHFSKFEF